MEQSHRIEVEYIDQSQIAPTGCESVSAVMALHYMGYPISVEDFVNKHLEYEEFTEREGVLYGPHPNDAFVGNPFSKDGFGCYPPVIQRAMQAIVQDDYEILNVTGTKPEELCHTYIDQDLPVLVWTTIDLQHSGLGTRYHLNKAPLIYTWRNKQHCLLLVGYDETSYWCNDPWNNHGLIAYEKRIFEDRCREMDYMAVAMRSVQR